MALESILSGAISTEDKMKIVEEFFKKSDVETKTDLDNLEIDCIIKMLYLDEFIRKEWNYDIKYDDMAKLYMMLKISHERKSRKEFVEIMKTYILDVFGQNTLARKLITR